MDSQIKEDKGRDQVQVSVLLRCLSYRDRRVGNPLSMAHMHCIISVFHNFFATLKRKKKRNRRNIKRKETLVIGYVEALCIWWQLRSMKCNREQFCLSVFHLDNIVTDINSTVFLLRISGMVNSSRDWSPPRATLEISPVFCARWMMWSHSSSDRKFGISWNEKHW